ncbi:MAG: sodium:alanine symporter family protein [bacterium]|nr:sodium:alanine symporter family protein [bacterium]
MMALLDKIDAWIWGLFLIFLLVGTGLFFAWRTRFIQIRKLGHAIALVRGKFDNPNDKGEISHFQALATALSATIGTGNIGGVATAIALGGPGAVFWMWVTGLLGSGIKFASCTLGIQYRVTNKDGSISGGPMYYLEHGLGMKWLAVLFAFFAAIASFGIGNMIQANSMALPLHEEFGLPKSFIGIVFAVLAGMVIIGGITRIGRFTGKLTPLMTVIYVGGALVILIKNAALVPDAFQMIFVHAFSPTAASGGFAGSAVAMAIRQGVAKGVFSNESGLGSAPIAHSAARTKEPVREGLVAMIGPFIDTLLICTLTALVIITTGAWQLVDPASGEQLTSTLLSKRAFGLGIPGGEWIVTIGIILFTFSTIIGWSYYGDRSVGYLFGVRGIKVYRWIYIVLIPFGAVMKVNLMWTISDITNGLMAFPNLVGLLLLSPVVVKLTKEYFSREHIPHQ